MTGRPGGRGRRRSDQPEEREQRLLIEWRDRVLADVAVRDSGLEDLHHIPNGGKRGTAEAGIFKALGTKPGIPDLHLPVSAWLFGPLSDGHDGIEVEDGDALMIGLYIEMKAIYSSGKKSYPSRVQLEIHERLRARGYRVVVCWTWIEAANAICDYLRLPERVRPMAAKELTLS